MGQFLMNTRIYTGESCLEQIKTLGMKRAYIICDPFMEKCGRAAELTEMLKQQGTETAIFSQVVPDPSIEVVTKAIHGMQQFQPDGIVALGGGSAIDTAKAAGQLYGAMLGQSRPLLAAVPTTSGTGSEVTSFAVISDTQAQVKYALRDQSLVPDAAFLDPKLTASVPPAITADTGMDVLTHALEAYVSTKADDFTDACAEKAIRLVWHYLERAVNDGSDMEARERMHNASCLAGIAFSNASLGICHSMAHALGASFHIPHGRSNALILTHVIGYNAGIDQKEDTAALLRYAQIAQMLGFDGATPRASVHNLIRQIRNLTKRIGLPFYVNELSVQPEDFRQEVTAMAEKAMKDNCTATNPRTPTQQEIERLYNELCKGGLV